MIGSGDAAAITPERIMPIKEGKNMTCPEGQEFDAKQGKCVPCPGGKIRSQGQGQGKGYGKGAGPIGVPYKAKSLKESLFLDAALKDMREWLSKHKNAKYDWDQCIKDQMKRYGSKETAEKVCGYIKSRYGG